MHPTDFTLAGALAALNEGAISAEELTRAHVAAVEALNPKLNAFITTTSEQALEAARASDARRKRGEAGPLEGIPLAIKDLFCSEGVRTTAGSKILGDFIPPYESTVTAQLKRDGAVFLGKANLDEFAMGSSNLTSAYGGVLNPWQRKDDPGARLVPGGSSGGSAAAVAARIALG
ncbi:MAG: amidase family protein, partial [Alphaproteobacteria bacterium]